MNQATIDRILTNTKNIAVVGFSSKTFRPGYYVPEYLQTQGYRIIPVNPYLVKAVGAVSYPSLSAVPEPIDLVLIFQRSEKAPPFVDEAIMVGETAVWMQLGIRHEGAAIKARAANIDVIMDACMLVEHKKWLRRTALHG